MLTKILFLEFSLLVALVLHGSRGLAQDAGSTADAVAAPIIEPSQTPYDPSPDKSIETADAVDKLREPSRQIQNLVFYPHRRVADFSPTLSFSTSDHTSQNASNGNALLSSMDRRKASFELNFTYGITHAFRLGITESELITASADTTDASTNATTQTHSSGISDPKISAIYRVIEHARSGIHADIGLNVTPSIGNRVKPQTSQDGNNLEGGSVVGLAVPVTWLWASNEFNLRGSIRKNFDATTQGSSSGQDAVTSSYWSESILVQDRYHFLLNRLYAQIGLIFNLPSSYDSTTAGTTSSTDTKLSLKRIVTLGILLNERITASIFTASTSYGSSTTKSGTSTSLTRLENEIGLSGSILF